MSDYAFNKAMTDRIETLDTQLAAAKAEIERLNDIGFKTERREQKYAEIMEQYRVETKRLREALKKILHLTIMMSDPYSRDIGTTALAALDGGKA